MNAYIKHIMRKENCPFNINIKYVFYSNLRKGFKYMIGGEICVKIKEIIIRKFKNNTYEMTLYDKDGACLHIVGDNNLEVLLKEALENIKEVQI